MKERITMLLDEDVLRCAKRQAAEEGRPLGDLIEDALERHLASKAGDLSGREAAYELFCQHPMRLTLAQLRAVLDEDAW